MSDTNQEAASAKREFSSVQFPYNDLDDAIGTAGAVLKMGGVPLERDQLAAALGLAASGGNFALKLSAARMFGLVEPAQGRFQLTELGFEILDPSRERGARAKAFLNVELYRKAFDAFKGKALPPRPHGLENAFVQFGVSPKQKDRARHVFDRSARSAGFFPGGNEDRLVQPVILDAPSSSPAERQPERQPDVEPQERALHDHIAVPTGRRLDPFIKGLLDRLPDTKPLPDKAEWSVEDRARWLQAAAQIFDLIYSGNDGFVAVEFKRKGGA